MDKTPASDGGLWRALEVMMVSFVVAGAAAAVLLFNFNGQGRLWDKLTGRQDEFGMGPRVVRASAPDASGGRMMIIADVPSPDAPAPAAAASAPAPKPAAAPAKKSWIKHIAGALDEYSITGPASQRSSASAGAADAPAPAPVSAARAAAPAAVAAAPAAAAPAAAPSYVNYGNTTRSDIMSSASGPVYNFAGKRK